MRAESVYSGLRGTGRLPAAQRSLRILGSVVLIPRSPAASGLHGALGPRDVTLSFPLVICQTRACPSCGLWRVEESCFPSGTQRSWRGPRGTLILGLSSLPHEPSAGPRHLWSSCLSVSRPGAALFPEALRHAVCPGPAPSASSELAGTAEPRPRELLCLSARLPGSPGMSTQERGCARYCRTLQGTSSCWLGRSSGGGRKGP